MIDAAPIVASIGMLASFALAGGGAWLAYTRRDRRRGLLMMAMALVLIGNVLIFVIPR